MRWEPGGGEVLTSTTSSKAAGNQAKSKGGGPATFPITIDSGTLAGHSATDDNTVTTEQTCPGVTEATLTGTFTVH